MTYKNKKYTSTTGNKQIFIKCQKLKEKFWEKNTRSVILENMRQDRIEKHGERMASETEKFKIEKENMMSFRKEIIY